MTQYAITFAYEDKEYIYPDTFNYEGWDEYRNADYQVIYMYTEGNYSCDCNRSDFIAQREEGFPEMDCGDSITLVSICEGERVVWPEPPEVVYTQQSSGIYIPMRG
jgi:hypothetical protein